MIYYLETENEKTKEKQLEKYLVSYDKEELEKLKLEIIDNCSVITHREYVGKFGPYHFDELKYRNYSEEKVGERKHNNIETYTENIYHYSYDQYDFPYLVTIIDNILKNDVNALKELFYPDTKKEVLFIEIVQMHRKELDETSYANPKEKIDKINEFKEFLKNGEKNKEQKSVWEYYHKVKELLTFTLIDIMALDNLYNFEKFFGVELSKNIKKKIYKQN